MPGQDDKKIVDEQRGKQDRLDKAIRQLEKHTKQNPDGTFELKVKNAREANADPEVFEQLERSLEEGNKYIRSGKVPKDKVRQHLDEPESPG